MLGNAEIEKNIPWGLNLNVVFLLFPFYHYGVCSFLFSLDHPPLNR